MDKLGLGQRVARAREDAQMTQEGLGRAIGVDRTAISRLEKGERKLNVTELLEIAATLGRPLSFFVEDPVPAVLSRRQDALRAHSSTRRLDQELQLFAGDVRFLQRMGLLESAARHAGARVPRDHAGAEAHALEARRRAGLDGGPIDDLAEACERLGLYSWSVALGSHGAEGACVEVSDDPRSAGAAVLNGDAPAGRRRMTLAHELGHWLFGDAYDAEASLHSEKMINSFAIHFLAPRTGVQAEWNRRQSWSTRDRALGVGAAFRLSWSAAIGQLRNLNLLSFEEHRALAEQEPRSGEYLRLELRWTDELTPPSLSPGYTAAVLKAYSAQLLTEERTLELLRGTVSVDDLPATVPPSLDDIRRSFAAHDG